jgi:hypothetical protein
MEKLKPNRRIEAVEQSAGRAILPAREPTEVKSLPGLRESAGPHRATQSGPTLRVCSERWFYGRARLAR